MIGPNVRFGDVPSGRHLRFPKGTPLANLQLTVLEKMGAHVEHYGDSTGTLSVLSAL